MNYGEQRMKELRAEIDQSWIDPQAGSRMGYSSEGIAFEYPKRNKKPVSQELLNLLLSDEEIDIAKQEAERLSWTYKPHPRLEKEIFLLKEQLAKVQPTFDQLTAKIAELEVELKVGNQLYADLTTKCWDLESLIHDLKQRIKDLHSDVPEVKK